MAIVNTHYGFCAKGGAVPKFTYTGEYNVRDDGVVELLTSGTLVFLNPAVIDVFCVGGGGAGGFSTDTATKGAGGGAGGYTNTRRKINVSGNVAVHIGAGGIYSANAPTYVPSEATTFGNYVTADGGGRGMSNSSGASSATSGGNGGSGGGGGTVKNTDGGVGGYDGQNGEQGGNSGGAGGTGQGTTTREFGESAGKLYAGGGGGGRFLSGSTPALSMGGAGGGGTGAWMGSSQSKAVRGADGVANTGGGGGGAASSALGKVQGGSGGSGICCFRNATKQS